jgi:hypothetical protein
VGPLYEDGLLVEGSGDVVEGNLVGLNAAGTAAVGNGSGAVITGPGNTIGGAGIQSRNILSGNVNGLLIA